MTDPWLHMGEPGGYVGEDVTVMEGSSFCISDACGDLPSGSASGLFVRDTRLASRWQLRVGGLPIAPLGLHHDAPFSAVFIGQVRWRDPVADPDVVVVRHRFVGEGMREDISLHNASSSEVDVDVELVLAVDFADLFEVKEGKPQTGVTVAGTVADDGIDFAVHRMGREFGVTVASRAPADFSDGRLRWRARIPGHGSWSTTLVVSPRFDGQVLQPHAATAEPGMSVPALRHREFRRGVPSLSTSDRRVAEVLRASIEDLGLLRMFDPEHPDLPLVAAGAPWFMALFGRDSLLTSSMLLSLDPTLAMGTLRTLATHQGAAFDARTEEEPGRILHEMRFGPAGTLALGGQNAYYGSVDATPLFVMLLGDLYEWHPELVTPDLLEHADRALRWMADLGDRDGDGFLEYERKTPSGLANQGWKDSWDGVGFADGRIARAPIALAEVQGYAYAAFLARARLADGLEGGRGAAEWRARAADLKQRFNEVFWLPDQGWYAIALDGAKEPVDALTSNIGHCLWTGIIDDDRVPRVVELLTSPELFSGWGIRTLARGMAGYDPMSYHNGSVWPHDTALCVAGMARYGFMEEAGRVAMAIFDAAESFGDRLPELFAGFGRAEVPVPVPYPAACRPQAWAAAAPVELLRSLLRLEARDGRLHSDPVVPARMLPLSLTDIDFRGEPHSLEVTTAGWSLRDSRPPASRG